MLHPSERRLNLFADGEVSAKWQRALLTRHLQACVRCRNTVMAVRALGRDAKALEVPPLPAELRGRVLEAASHRAPAIVPVADPPRRGSLWQRLAWVGAGAVLAAVAIRMVLAPAEVRSEASMLEFTPEQPAPGARVTVTYRATPRFAGHTELRLRARYRRAREGPSASGVVPVVAASLTSDGNGSYRGAVELPPDVVYGAFAVEDVEGRTVDAHGVLGWELLTNEDGQPSRDALLQSTYEAMGRDLGLALERATRATVLYPDLVAAWMGRSTIEQAALGSVATDSLRVSHLSQLRMLHLALRDRPVPPDMAESMYFYAKTLDTLEVAEWWYRRLLEEWPTSPASAQLQAVALLQNVAAGPDSVLRALEQLWTDENARHGAVPQLAFEFARDVGNGTAACRWALRWIAVEPWNRLFVATELATNPAVRDTALAWLRAEATALERPQDARRPLYRSVEQQRENDARERREVLGLMGRVALAAEQPEAALALLDSATARGWTLKLFDAAASARLQVGDVTGGVEMLARLAVDPAYGGPDAAARALTLVRPDEWAREVDRARTRMIEVTLAAARARGIPGPLRVSDEEGTEHDLQELIGGHVSVVALFWPACRTCVSELHQLRDLQRRLPVSLRTVLVSGSPLLPSQLEFLRAEGVPFPVVVDNYGAVAEALEPRGRPQYFLLDRHGTIRFSYTSLEDIPRQVLALSGGEPPVT